MFGLGVSGFLGPSYLSNELSWGAPGPGSRALGPGLGAPGLGPGAGSPETMARARALATQIMHFLFPGPGR